MNVKPTAWALLTVQDPEITLDPDLAAYWARKGREVSELYACPKKITENMHVAAVKASNKCTGNDDFPQAVWLAMLSAANTGENGYEKRMERDMEGCNGLGLVSDRRFKRQDTNLEAVGKILDHLSQLQMLWGLGEAGALVRFSEVSEILFSAARVFKEEE